MNYDATETAFHAKLIAAGYRRTTADKYVRTLRQTAETEIVPSGGIAPAAARLWLAWTGHPDDHPSTNAARRIQTPTVDGFGGIASVAQRRASQLRRKRQARSLPEAEWHALLDVLARGHDATDAALRVIAETGLRVGDVLGITQGELARGETSGVVRLDAKGGEPRLLPWAGASDAWGDLLEAFPDEPSLTVAEVVANFRGATPEAGSAAYMRLDRRLKKHALALKLDGVVHLHRLRRTVAVVALRETRDIVAVQELLGHSSIATTSRYLDEARPEVVAELQTKIRERTTKVRE